MHRCCCTYSCTEKATLTPESELFQRVREDGVLDDSLLPGIVSHLSDAQDDLREYEEQAAHLRARLQILDAKITALKRNVDLTRSLLSPTRRIPNEILARIFEFCDVGLIPADRRYRDPAILSVSTRWRTVALTNPSIWNCITLEVFQMAYRQNLPALERILERSKSTLLSVTIFLKQDGSGIVGPRYTTKVIEALIQHSSRWSHIAIQYNGSTEASSCLHPLATAVLDARNLKEVAISSLVPPSWFSKMLTSPKLDTLSVAALSQEGIANIKSSASLRKLRFSICGAYNPATLKNLEVMDGLGTLKELELDLRYPMLKGQSDNPAPLSITSPLTTLSVELTKGDPEADQYNLLTRTISCLTLPSVQKLSICANVRTIPKGFWPIQQFHDFFQRSECSITSLKLCGLNLTDQALIALLSCMPALTDLCLAEWKTYGAVPTIGLTTEAIQALHSTDYALSSPSFNVSQPLVPKLSRLRLTVNQTFDEEILANVVDSRRNLWTDEVEASVRVAELKSMGFKLSGRKINEEARKKLMGLQQGGLRLTIQDERS
ncbi:hypothetical protein D9758_014919 [Tetrapyrgos nigripes]|uniref:F-box domain-containing protein n=1 Tax=Tetrapyrgos nigripes TaxID=182062 RepID=A0A8H5FI28_9AGAR|nr:hypothetical protein D9758_014919 [Tetrapyrgos nigripes]